MNSGSSASPYWPDASSASSAAQTHNHHNHSYATGSPSSAGAQYGAQSGYNGSSNGYSVHGQAQQSPTQASLYHSQQHHAHRPSLGLAIGNNRQQGPGSSSSSSLQYALRPQTQHTSLSAHSSPQNPAPSSFSPSSSLSTSLSLSSLSSASSLNSNLNSNVGGGEMANLSPISPHAFAPHQSRDRSGSMSTHPQSHILNQQSQGHHAQNHVHYHVYQGHEARTATSNQTAHANINSEANFDINSSRLYAFDNNGHVSSTSVSIASVRPGSGSGSNSGSGSVGMDSPRSGLAMHYNRSTNPHAHSQSPFAHTHPQPHTRPPYTAHTGSYNSHDNRNPQAYASVPRTHVKTEPDLEESCSLHHRDPAASPELSNNAGGSGGARFVMEHPYPYHYASPSVRGRDNKRKSEAGLRQGRSVSPLSPQSGASYPPTSSAEGLQSPQDLGSVSAQPNFQESQPQHAPHSLTAPLRAVNASAPMRACMGVFRLDPFAQLNGVALRCGGGFVSDNDPFLSGDFSSKRSKGKSKNKSKKKTKGKNKKRKRSNSDSASPGLDDEDGDEDEDAEDEIDDAPTWDGLPAGPLTEEPVLLEFQLYFEGMEVEGEDHQDVPAVAVNVVEQGNEEELEDFFDDSVDSYGRTYLTRGHEESTNNRVERERESRLDRLSLRAMNRPTEDAMISRRNNTAYGLEDRKSDVQHHEHGHERVQSRLVRARAATTGVLEEYLHLNLDVDLDGWVSAEPSPTTPHPLSQTHSQTSSTAFSQTQHGSAYSRTPDSTPTRIPQLGGNNNNNNSTADNNSSSPFNNFTNTHNINGVFSRSRYIDSSGYIRLSDAHVQMSSGNSSNAPSGQPSNPSPFASSFSGATGTGAVAATLQQLRTQAALRAVSAHTQNNSLQALSRGYSEGGNAQRGNGPANSTTAGGATAQPAGGAGGAVNFTPTPASVAAEMQSGLLASSRSHQQQQQAQQQHQQQGCRMRATSVSHRIGGNSNNNNTSAYSSYAPAGGIPPSSSSASRSGYAYADYVSNTPPSASDTNNSLAGALTLPTSASSMSPSPPLLTHALNQGSGVRSSTGVVAEGVEAAAYGAPSANAIERRWSDALQQRVHA
ncbi:uncharacterized protein FOMMEDRAFT_32343 [Fomitiporia mediterranea MF3/22]|uniref:Uncharacterized protein n=1 Tax=Fomitiporia mediterranea (strain MF3/22) TaxID=694068 RepID=R7SHJ9_FOMME|nr:uncharacterized protein FOMMEDRAFT_32343 [Fomitiporia mediterranea MF3/22]EJC97732.1 hypothetical protein FOMMEDRAFT_32343 [Fomitiporia mediterranea MF3/22]